MYRDILTREPPSRLRNSSETATKETKVSYVSPLYYRSYHDIIAEILLFRRQEVGGVLGLKWAIDEAEQSASCSRNVSYGRSWEDFKYHIV